MSNQKPTSNVTNETKVFIEEYKGHPLFAVWQIDENGNKVGKYGPIVSLGKKKAEAILANLEELKKFVEEQNNSPRNED